MGKKLKYLKSFDILNEAKTELIVGDYVSYKHGESPERTWYGKIIKVLSNDLYRIDGYGMTDDGLMFDSSKTNEKEKIQLTKTNNKKFNEYKSKLEKNK